jgi:prefoldin subunit 5
MTSTIENAPPSAAPQAPHEGIRFGLCKRSNPQNTAPVLDYIEDLGDFLKKQGLEDRADEVVEELNRLLRGLKIHQQKLASEKADLERRLPELKDNVRLIEELKRKDETKIRFMAADSVWIDGMIEKPKDGSEPKVALWLGAGVMMEYTYGEAEELLGKSITSSETAIENKRKELIALKQQITTCEVTMARFYNFELARKRQSRKQEEEAKAMKASS